MRAARPSYYYVCVIERDSRIVASASLVLEWKFIHSAGFRGRIEDVVVDEVERGKRLGNVLIEHLTALGRYLGCYKMSLECKDALTGFYGRCGYAVDAGNNFMVQRFDEKPSTDAVVATASAVASVHSIVDPCEPLSALILHQPNERYEHRDEASDDDESYDLANEPPIELIMTDSKKPHKSCMTPVDMHSSDVADVVQPPLPPKVLQFRENISFIE